MFILGEVQIGTTLRGHSLPIRLAKIQEFDNVLLVDMQGNRPPVLLVEMQNGLTSLEGNLQDPAKLGRSLIQ